MKLNTTEDTMAVDNHGQTYHALGKHPRTELMKRIGCSSAKRMFADLKDGSSQHVGWVVGSHWCMVYYVRLMRIPAGKVVV